MIDMFACYLLFGYLTVMVVIAQFKGDTSIANFTWGGGVLLLTWYSFFAYSSFFPEQILITSLISLWGLRLIAHVYMRYTGKDPRFATWKWQGLKALVINICWIFGQTIMIAIMSFPAVFINVREQAHFQPHAYWVGLCLDLLGLSLWIFGYCCEAISDSQLAAFMRNPLNKGRVMRYGLWQYSRHPNYFGEIVMWWGIYFLTLAVLTTMPAQPLLYCITLIPPVTITVLLLFVTGIPWIEKAMANNPEYQEYKRKTSILIPWFTKK